MSKKTTIVTLRKHEHNMSITVPHWLKEELKDVSVMKVELVDGKIVYTPLHFNFFLKGV